jgi:hypothetical protein
MDFLTKFLGNRFDTGFLAGIGLNKSDRYKPILTKLLMAISNFLRPLPR